MGGWVGARGRDPSRVGQVCHLILRFYARGCVLWRRAPGLATADASVVRCFCCWPFIGVGSVSVLTGLMGTHHSAVLASYVRSHLLPRACG